MVKNLNEESLYKKLETKSRHRLKKKHPKMAVSGKSVLTLRRIIKKRASSN